MFHFFCPDCCLWHLLLLRAKTAWVLKGIRQTGWLECQSWALAWQWVFKGTKKHSSNGFQLVRLDLSHRWGAGLVLLPCWHGVPHWRRKSPRQGWGPPSCLPSVVDEQLSLCFLHQFSILNLTFEFATSTSLAVFSVDQGEKGTQREKRGNSSRLLCCLLALLIDLLWLLSQNHSSSLTFLPPPTAATSQCLQE